MYKNYQFGDLNSAYIMGLYEDYLSDPDSVGLDLVDFFQSQDFKNILSNLSSEKNTFNDTTKIVESNETQFKINLFNLKAETAYEYQVFTVSENEKLSAGSVSIFETGELPDVLKNAEFKISSIKNQYR